MGGSVLVGGSAPFTAPPSRLPTAGSTPSLNQEQEQQQLVSNGGLSATAAAAWDAELSLLLPSGSGSLRCIAHVLSQTLLSTAV